MAKALTPGAIGQATVLVTPETTAASFGNPGAMVFATPLLVGLMEKAAIAALSPFLEDGEGSVGTKVDIVHLAATPVGMTVRAEARLVEAVGKRAVFEVTAYDDVEKVGNGTHERYIIQTAPFFAKVARKSG